MHCNRYRPAPLSRRELLKASGFGFGTFALNAMFAQKAAAEVGVGKLGVHHEAKAMVKTRGSMFWILSCVL